MHDAEAHKKIALLFRKLSAQFASLVDIERATLYTELARKHDTLAGDTTFADMRQYHGRHKRKHGSHKLQGKEEQRESIEDLEKL